MAAFHIYESSSPISGLFLLYDYYYSPFFQKNNNIMDNMRVLNLIFIAKEKLSQTETGRLSPLLKKFEMTKLLKYKKRVENLEVKLKDAANSKLMFYAQLNETQMDYIKIVKLGSSAYDKIDANFKEISSLMKISTRDYTLVKRAIFLEKFLMEKTLMDPELNKMIEEAISDFHNTKGIESSIESNQYRFNQFNADNAVVLVSSSGPPYKFSHVSGNYRKFFDSKQSQIIGSTLETFMPDLIAKNHNRYLLDFLQGTDTHTKLRYLSTCVKRQGKIC